MKLFSTNPCLNEKLRKDSEWPQNLFIISCSGSAMKTELLIRLVGFSIALIIPTSKCFIKNNNDYENLIKAKLFMSSYRHGTEEK